MAVHFTCRGRGGKEGGMCVVTRARGTLCVICVGAGWELVPCQSGLSIVPRQMARLRQDSRKRGRGEEREDQVVWGERVRCGTIIIVGMD